MYEYDRTEAREYENYARRERPQNTQVSPVIWANAFFSIITIVIAFMSGQTSLISIGIVSGIYFTVSTSLFLVIGTGTLADVLRTRAEQHTRLELYRMQYTVRTPPAEGLPESEPRPAPQLQHSTYVPAADDGVRREALAWAVTLFGRDGQPHPDKVNMKGGTEPPGRLKTAAPANPEVKQFLLDRKVIVRIKNGYKLHLGRCPSAAELRENLW